MNFHPVFKTGSFYLLLALLFYFVISPIIVDDQVGNVALSILMFTIIAVCVDFVSWDRTAIVAITILGVLSLLGYWTVCCIHPSRFYYIAHISVNGIFLTCMTLFVITSVAKRQEITIDTILGAICGYLLIGLTWSYVYLLLAMLDPNAFSFHMIDGTIRNNVQHFIYFSFVTLTTLGYGDVVPYTDQARAFSWLEAATGQIYLAVWISQLVGLHIAQRIRKDNATR